MIWAIFDKFKKKLAKSRLSTISTQKSVGCRSYPYRLPVLKNYYLNNFSQLVTKKKSLKESITITFKNFNLYFC